MTVVNYEVFELRTYKVDPARRREFIDHFERQFIHTQEADGIAVLGQFEVVGQPDRFVWIRAFPDMRSRSGALRAFYGGDVWQEHGPRANEIMREWDDVYLLRPTPSSPAIAPGYRPDAQAPPPARDVGSSHLLAVVAVCDGVHDDVPDDFAAELSDRLRAGGGREIGRFVAEPTENDFQRLPVKQEQGTVASLVEAPSRTHADRLLGSLGDLVNPGGRPLLLSPTPRSFLPERPAG